MNKTILIGNLGKDPDELKHSKKGTPFTRFSVATEGMDKDDTQWHSITVFGKSAEPCTKYLSKGKKVMVEGWIQYSKSEKDGQARWFTNIVAQRVEFLSPKGEDGKEEEKTKEKPEFDDDIPF